MSKLQRARSLLYRRQILQVNIRWKALDEIYKIYMLLHRSDLNISAKFRHEFLRIFHNFSNNIVKIVQCSCRFVLKLHWQSITKKMTMIFFADAESQAVGDEEPMIFDS